MKEEVRKLVLEFAKNEFPRIYDINKSRTIWKEQSEHTSYKAGKKQTHMI